MQELQPFTRGSNVTLGSRRPTRRKGQALLMAVLLMVFAALLGATFVTVVALNLNQSGRQEDRSVALASTQAGLLWVNKQLTDSELGERWRPERISPPPAPGDADYEVYYTPVERAQGWARTVPHPSPGDAEGGDWDNDGLVGTTPNTEEFFEDDWARLEQAKLTEGARVFAKFPDPRQPAAGSTPTYLAEVSLITDSADPNTGMLRVTVIGQSQESQTVFLRRSAFKPTSRKGAPVAYARYDANYTRRGGKPRPIAAELAAPVASGSTTITVPSGASYGMDPGWTLLIGHGPQREVVVISRRTESASGDTLELRTALGNSFNAGTPVAVISTQLAGLLLVDATGEGTPAAATESPLDTTDGGFFINSGLHMLQKAALMLGNDDRINVAGSIVNSSSQALLVDRDDTNVTAVVPDSTMTGTRTALQQQVRDGSLADNSPTGDGLQRLAPPSLDGAFSRYREATRMKDLAAGSLYGYGPGLYINNDADQEKVQKGTGFRELSALEVHRLYQRKGFAVATGETGNAAWTSGSTVGSGSALHRLSYPRPGVDTYAYPASSGSLEQRGIRGWVSPWEYRPRGVLIELQGTKIVVTRDDRSDSTTFVTAPDSNKTWATPQGTPIPASYRMTLETSSTNSVARTVGVEGSSSGAYVADTYTGGAFNGVIFAEGNVRIRGMWGSNSGRDLTVVSMGNIYVEGNLRGTAGTNRKIALLAKKNVVLNPTAFLPRPSYVQDRDVAAQVTPTPTATPGTDNSDSEDDNDVATDPRTADIYTSTVASSSFANSATSTWVPVTDSSRFRVGDQVQIGDNVRWVTVWKVEPGASKLLVSGSNSYASGQHIRLLSDPAVVKGTNEYYYELRLRRELLARDFNFNGATPGSDLRLGLRHAGEMKRAIKMQLRNGTLDATVAIKEDNMPSGSPDGLLHATERYIKATGEHPLMVDLGTVSSSGVPHDDATQTLDALHQRYNAQADDGLPRWRLSGWPSYDENIPARYLAAIGDQSGSADDTLVNATTPLVIPLSTSIGGFWYPNRSTVDDAMGSYTNTTLTFWSNPQMVIGAAYNASGYDTVASTRESFYWRPDPAAPANRLQAGLQWQTTTFTSVPGSYANLMMLRREAENPDSDLLPAYRVAGWRLENGSFDPLADGATRPFTPALDVRVEATIFAQEGSCFVIPVPLNNRLDANENATVEDTERYFATRYLRPNYRVVLAGSIAQNVTPTADVDYNDEPDGDGNKLGAVQQWTNSLSYPTEITANAIGTYGHKWQGVRFEAYRLPTTHTLMLPTTPDISEAR